MDLERFKKIKFEWYNCNFPIDDNNITWLIKTVEDLHSELQETNDLNEHLGDKIDQYIEKLSEKDSAVIKTYQKATERINGLEKRIQELESEVTVLKIINNSI